MPLWTQHLLVLLLVAGCVAFTLREVVQALWGRRSKIGSCCAKGCQTAPRPAEAKAERVVFLPLESLKARTPRRPRD